MSFQKLKEAWENRPRPIANLSDDNKVALTVFTSPVFPVLHALESPQDFKKFWTEDRCGKKMDAVQKGGLALLCTGMTAAWFSAASLVDNAVAVDTHKDKIKGVVSEIACKAPEVDTQVVCGVGDVSATHRKIPLNSGVRPGMIDTGAMEVFVKAEKKSEPGTAKNGELAQKVCDVLKYATVPQGTGFISDKDWKNNGRVLSNECKVLAL